MLAFSRRPSSALAQYSHGVVLSVFARMRNSA